MYLYLVINLLSISIPFIASFDKRLKFYKQWKYFFPAMILTLVFFIVWDVFFTHLQVWGFNPKYLTGLTIINLPAEEWLFFMTIPYACVFTYEALNYIIKRDYLSNYSKWISWILIFLLVSIALANVNRLYTSVTFGLTAILLLVLVLFIKPSFLGRFYLAYVVTLIPFFIVNGILTGTFIEEEVVWYDNSRNLGIRLLTIPIEDSVFGFLLILMNITLYETFKNYQRKKLILPV
jgi:lycopene cyclase domain-containing protein